MGKNFNLKEKLMRIHTALSNCLKEPFVTKLQVRGYTDVKINELLAFQRNVAQLDRDKDASYLKQFQSTEELEELSAGIKFTYSNLRKLAQVALINDESTIRALGLDHQIKSSFSSFLAQGRRFYRAVLSDEELAAKLAGVGITAEEITAELTKLDELEQLNITQEFEKKAAQDATRQRDDQLQDLEREMSSLYKVAQVALADDPRYLELLNINRHI